MPPLEEQRRIAEILDTIDETIQATERVIAKLSVLRHGLIASRFCRAGAASGRALWPIVELGSTCDSADHSART